MLDWGNFTENLEGVYIYNNIYTEKTPSLYIQSTCRRIKIKSIQLFLG